MNSPRTALAEALNASRGEDVIAGVKNAVIAEIEGIDANIEIHSTDYFNHSFAPDLVLNWTAAGKKVSRDVFLRYSFRSAKIGRDVPALADLGPIVLALREDADRTTLDEVRRDVEDAPRLLLTDMPALDDILDRNGNTSNAESDSARLAQRRDLPLLDLFRSNVMRGGRGLLVSDTANTIKEQMQPSIDPEGSLRNIESFSSLVQNLFLSDAATRLTRSAQLLYMGLSGDVSQLTLPQLAEDSESDNSLGDLVQGRLSDAELRVLVPYLLRRPDVTTEPAFWAHIGSMMSLERLESMWGEFSDLDLSPLVTANLDSWSARRVALSLNAEAIDDDWSQDSDKWHIHARMLCLVIGAWRLHFSVDGRKTKGRDSDNPSARWDEITPTLLDYALSSVTMQGIARKLRIDSENSADIYDDITAITSAVVDNYTVPSLEVRTSIADDAPLVDVDFRKMLATANDPATIRDLGHIALNVLGYKSPTHLDEDGLI